MAVAGMAAAGIDCISCSGRSRLGHKPLPFTRTFTWPRHAAKQQQQQQQRPWVLRCSAEDDSERYESNDPAARARERRRKLRTELVRKALKAMHEDQKEIDYPLWMDDEGDPNWNDDEPEDGWGFNIEDFFKKPKIINEPREEGEESDSELDNIDWDSEEHFEWMVLEISQMEWHEVIFDDQRPVVVFVYERYGPRWSPCWNALKELEKAVKTFYDKKKIGLRAAKIDAERDKDLVAALKLESIPAMLIISDSKLVHRIYGFRTEEQILQAVAHFFHGARRPAFLGTGINTPEELPDIPRKKKEKKA